MPEENKKRLPHVIDGISMKLHSLFFQKLYLYDSEVLEAKHLRHYDYECEGVYNLINFIERRINKNQIFAFQMFKNVQSELSDEGEFAREDSLRY